MIGQLIDALILLGAPFSAKPSTRSNRCYGLNAYIFGLRAISSLFYVYYTV